MKNVALALTLLMSCLMHSTIANAKIKYYGYDWLDYYQYSNPAFNAADALNAINNSGFSETNLNVVHSIKSLSLPVCNDGKCALNIQAGLAHRLALHL